MPQHVPEISGGSIVLLGSFNPKIFQPEWFFRQELLSEDEVKDADIKVIAPQISHFETERFAEIFRNHNYVDSCCSTSSRACR